MKKQTRRIEISIETHEIKVIRFRNNGKSVGGEIDVSDEERFRVDQPAELIDPRTGEPPLRMDRTGGKSDSERSTALEEK